VIGLPDNGGLGELVARFGSFPPIAVLSWLMRPPVEVFAAGSFAAFALWFAITLAVFVLLVVFMAVLDVAYSEGALERAEKVQARLNRIRSGGGAFAAAGPRRGGLRIPALPHWSGAGPMAWRQLQELARNYRAALMMGVFMLMFVGMFLIMPRMVNQAATEGREMPAALPLVMLAVITPMMTTNGAFDFRRDLDRMALLKTFPISGFALAFGQVLPTALLVTVWELVALIFIAIMYGQIGPMLAVGIVIVLLPLNLVLIALDNVIFLKLPYRIVAKDPGRVPFMPRLMLVMFLKMLVLFVLAGLTAIPGVIAWALTQNALVAAFSMALFLLGCSALAIMGVAVAFKSFDVSRDIPD
jgi:hypothetical protein